MESNDIKYRNYIKGKRAIFVGPSPCILGKGNGDFIDSYDVVIRTNGSFPVKSELKKDYGKRCDSLYINGLYARKTNLPIKDYITGGIKYIHLKKDTKGLISRHKRIPILFRDIESSFISASKSIGASPLMGNYIIWEILNYGAREIYLTGMDCYVGNDTYVDGYLPSECNIDNLAKNRINSHKQDIQNRYLKNLILEGKVNADEIILKALNI